nr:methyl-accepting chemotaxis protein [Bacillus alkalicellulosilyticus]
MIKDKVKKKGKEKLPKLKGNKKAFSTLTIKVKLLLIFLLISVIFLIGSGITLYNVSQINKTNDKLETAMEIRAITLEIESDVRQQVSFIRAILLEGSNPEYFANIEAANESVIDAVNRGLAISTEPTTNESLERILDLNDSYLKSAHEVYVVMEESQETALRIADSLLFTLGIAMDRITNEVVVAEEEILANVKAEAELNIALARFMIIITSVVAIVLSVTLGVIVSSRMSKPIKELAVIADRVSDGDLTVTIKEAKSKDEIGTLTTSFKTMTENLRSMIDSISINSSQVAASAEELSASAEQTSRASEEISLAIDEVAKGTDVQMDAANKGVEALHQVSKGVEYIAENSASISANADVSYSHAAEGGELVNQTVASMTTINKTVLQMDGVSKELLEQSNQIGTILKVIKDIAEQTNLLALNAAIEAARAGEHGKGFSVVADEVRKLAEQSGHSVVQINQIIEKIQNQTNETVMMMGEVKKEVDNGLTISQNTEGKFIHIIDSLKGIKEQIEGMTSTSQEIAAQSQEAQALVEDMANLAVQAGENTLTVSASSEESLATMEEITSSAESLSNMSDELSKIIERFKI